MCVGLGITAVLPPCSSPRPSGLLLPGDRMSGITVLQEVLGVFGEKQHLEQGFHQGGEYLGSFAHAMSWHGRAVSAATLFSTNASFGSLYKPNVGCPLPAHLDLPRMITGILGSFLPREAGGQSCAGAPVA